MRLRHTITTISAAQTQRAGQRLAHRLRGGEVVALVGDLGAGKTVLVKGIAVGLGIKHRITSPTFVLMRVYSVRGHKKIKRLVHVDAYRLRSPSELVDIGLLDYLGKPDTVTVIEWADRVKKIRPRRQITVTMKLGKNLWERMVNIGKVVK